MDYYVVIPIHNEEDFLQKTLDSVLEQTLAPKKVILVNDNSTDNTENIINEYTLKSSVFKKINSISSAQHMPGSKVVNAFNKGLEQLDENYNFIVKLDADLILPSNYFETISNHFKQKKNLGICGGFIYEQNNNGEWVLNHPMDKDHIRGAIKAYSKKCFKAIGGLKNAMGWDTVDELLARYNDFTLHTDDELKVKHLRPTGKAYNAKAKRLQGKAMYSMRYGFIITTIASLKMALKNNSIKSFWNNMVGYINASKNNNNYLVTEEEGKFIRNLRWTNIKRKIGV
ncbi:glycosyltransferase family 2 protein [Maribacter dokdonensis]|uniref:glycosyltransferase family 2 protein n=1 Tax=Maribacter dokdonensis TaxID=320912 RepID=UPI001B2F20DF|nr:glycosyltransferase family A protein [Maribacter dokdonensis]MDP2525553.1 glycosyltransferase family A protein [Maribacter dokdonensis]CAG2534895.1 Glycosyl transferase family 2 [Maribacter dokdonensis]